jgi:hypothetical protein
MRRYTEGGGAPPPCPPPLEIERGKSSKLNVACAECWDEDWITVDSGLSKQVLKKGRVATLASDLSTASAAHIIDIQLYAA